MKYLLNVKRGAVRIWTPELAQKEGLVPCDKDGRPLDGGEYADLPPHMVVALTDKEPSPEKAVEDLFFGSRESLMKFKLRELQGMCEERGIHFHARNSKPLLVSKLMGEDGD